MEAEDPVGVGIDDQLDQHPLVAAGDPVGERLEEGAVDVERAKLRRAASSLRPTEPASGLPNTAVGTLS